MEDVVIQMGNLCCWFSTFFNTLDNCRQDEQLKTLFAWAKEPKLSGRCKGQEITGIQASSDLFFSPCSVPF